MCLVTVEVNVFGKFVMDVMEQAKWKSIQHEASLDRVEPKKMRNVEACTVYTESKVAYFAWDLLTPFPTR